MVLFKNSALAREVAIILTIKLMALFGIWYFFVHDHKVVRTPTTVTQHLFQER